MVRMAFSLLFLAHACADSAVLLLVFLSVKQETRAGTLGKQRS